MDEVQLIGTMLKNYLLSAVFLCLFFMLTFSNVINSLSSLFLSDDLDLPLTAPLNPLSVYMARFFEVMVKSSWMVILLLIPVMTAFQVNFSSGWFFHLLWPVALIPYLMLTTAAGLIIATGMAALFPVRRAATALRAIFIIGIGLAIVVLRLLQPEQLVVPDKFYNFGRFLMSIHSPAANILPSYYLSRIIISFLTMDFFHLSWLTARYVPLPFLFLFVSWIVHQKLFMKGWRKMRDQWLR